jgi:sodium transport system ATP-binding protein
VIEARELRRSFGKVEAVRGVSLRAEDGHITGLLGPNGAGKTTTLRLLCALLQPDGGSIQVDGIDAWRDPLAARRRLGVLPDQRGLYKRLTARENIEYFGRLNGIGEDELRLRTDELIAGLDMREIEHRHTEGFSQGQRVKTAIARALVHRPQNLMLDEPTNGLDVMSIRALRQFLFQLRNEGRCVIFSSHVMQEVAALCDDIYVISQGRVVAHGTPDALRAQTGESSLEDAFVKVIGSAEGLLA